MNSSGFSTVNPSTGEQIETFSYFSSAETEAAISRADRSFQSFRRLSLYRRAQLLTELAETLRKNKAQLAKVITTEMGKFSQRPKQKSRSARTRPIGMPRTDRRCWQMHPPLQEASRHTFLICRLGQYLQSCRGIFRFGS